MFRSSPSRQSVQVGFPHQGKAEYVFPPAIFLGVNSFATDSVYVEGVVACYLPTCEPGWVLAGGFCPGVYHRHDRAENSSE